MIDMSNNKDLLIAFGKIRRQVGLLANQAFAELGLNTQQFSLLRVLLDEPALSLSELSQRTHSDLASVSRSVQGMLREKWLNKLEDPHDQRRWRLKLTPKGKRLITQAEAVHGELAQRLFKGLGRTERAQLQKLLKAWDRSLRGVA